MMPTTARLTRAQCSDLLKNPSLKGVFNRLGTLKYIKSDINKGFCVVTGSKQQKKAVKRNKIRRQLYTIFSTIYKNNDKTPIIAMLHVSKHSYGMSFEELFKECNDLLTKAQKNT